jgi:type II restriction enzyme
VDGFIALIIDIVKANGLARAQIHQQRAALTLPGFFLPTKVWGMLVSYKKQFVAAVELKSQVGA